MERTNTLSAVRAPESARLLVPFSVLAIAAVAPLTPAVAITATVGMMLLVLTLIPANLVRLVDRSWIRSLAKMRKWIGISSGIWLLGHGVIAMATVPSAAERPTFVFGREILPGALAMVMVVAMLATSSAPAQRLLGTRWKTMHRFVWVAVSLGLAHGATAAIRFDNEHAPPPWLPIVTLGLIAFLAFEAASLLRGGSRTPFRHAMHFGIGVAISLVVNLALA
jgi:DMSO/TMAO reductase YedYZ heme-binding membrane subunit